jgi:hypothetical protein
MVINGLARWQRSGGALVARLRRAAWFAVVALVGALALSGLQGCAEEGLVREEQRAADIQADTEAAEQALAAALQRHQQAVGAGVAELEAAAAAIRELREAQAVDPAIAEAVAGAVGAGLPAAEALAAARATLEAQVRAQTEYRAELQRRIPVARDSDDAWFSMGEWGAGLLSGLIPGGAGAGAAVVALMRKRKAAKLEAIKARKDGVVVGAGMVRDSVRVGRAADPEFDALFSGDGPAARAMREAIDRFPEVAAIVRAASAPRVKPPPAR